jgi:hypothetical protein
MSAVIGTLHVQDSATVHEQVYRHCRYTVILQLQSDVANATRATIDVTVDGALGTVQAFGMYRRN